MADVEMFFDCSSPWTYLAFEGLIGMQAEDGFAICWRPILVGGIFNTINPSVYAGRESPVPAKTKYAAKDAQDWARRAGVKILWRPSIFPINSVRAMRACIVADGHGKLVPFARRTFELYWGEDRDITKDDALDEGCRAAGLEARDVLSAIETAGIKSALRANTDELIERGGFGSPTMFVGRDDMYFGNDRLMLVREAVARARSR